MTDRPEVPRDDLDDDVTLEGDDELFELIRRQAAERAGGKPAPADDLDDDVTIADPGTLEDLQRRAEGSRPLADPPPMPSPPDGPEPWSMSPKGRPAASQPQEVERPPDVLDDPTVGAPEGHPSRPDHPILGSPPPVGRAPTPAPEPPPRQVPDPGPRLEVRPELDTSVGPDQVDRDRGASGAAPSGGDSWSPPATARREATSWTGPAQPEPKRRSALPPWVVPTLAALVVVVLLVLLLR